MAIRKNELRVDDVLLDGDWVAAGEHCYAVLRPDGLFCIYSGRDPFDPASKLLWSPHEWYYPGKFLTFPIISAFPTDLPKPHFATLGYDGNFCVYHGTPDAIGRLLYCAKSPETCVEGDYHARLHSDGRMLVYHGTPEARGARAYTFGAAAQGLDLADVEVNLDFNSIPVGTPIASRLATIPTAEWLAATDAQRGAVVQKWVAEQPWGRPDDLWVAVLNHLYRVNGGSVADALAATGPRSTVASPAKPAVSPAAIGFALAGTLLKSVGEKLVKSGGPKGRLLGVGMSVAAALMGPLGDAFGIAGGQPEIDWGWVLSEVRKVVREELADFRMEAYDRRVVALGRSAYVLFTTNGGGTALLTAEVLRAEELAGELMVQNGTHWWHRTMSLGHLLLAANLHLMLLLELAKQQQNVGSRVIAEKTIDMAEAYLRQYLTHCSGILADLRAHRRAEIGPARAGQVWHDGILGGEVSLAPGIQAHPWGIRSRALYVHLMERHMDEGFASAEATITAWRTLSDTLAPPAPASAPAPASSSTGWLGAAPGNLAELGNLAPNFSIFTLPVADMSTLGQPISPVPPMAPVAPSIGGLDFKGILEEPIVKIGNIGPDLSGTGFGENGVISIPVPPVSVSINAGFSGVEAPSIPVGPMSAPINAGFSGVEAPSIPVGPMSVPINAGFGGVEAPSIPVGPMSVPINAGFGGIGSLGFGPMTFSMEPPPTPPKPDETP